jgi:hypothetical protein
MEAPVTTLAYPLVTFSFNEPFNNGLAVTAYQVKIYSEILAQFIEVTALCDGASAPIVASRACSIPMATLIASYGIVQSQLIKAQVRAYNSAGWGT